MENQGPACKFTRSFATQMLTFEVAWLSAPSSIDHVRAATGDCTKMIFYSRLGGVPGGRSGSVSLPLPTSTAVQTDMVSWIMLLRSNNDVTTSVWLSIGFVGWQWTSR